MTGMCVERLGGDRDACETEPGRWFPGNGMPGLQLVGVPSWVSRQHRARWRMQQKRGGRRPPTVRAIL